MYLFLFLVFPVLTACFFYSVFHGSDGKMILRHKVLCSMYGVFSAAVLCAIYAFFVFSAQYEGTNLLIFSLHNWISGFLVPALFFIFYILWSNDSWQERISSGLYFALPFYSVYLPYFTLKQIFSTSFYMGFLNPVVCAFAVFAICKQLNVFYECLINKNRMIFVSFFAVLIESFIPSLLTSFWFYGLNIVFVILLSAASCFLSVIFAGIKLQPVVEEVKLASRDE